LYNLCEKRKRGTAPASVNGGRETDYPREEREVSLRLSNWGGREESQISTEERGGVCRGKGVPFLEKKKKNPATTLGKKKDTGREKESIRSLSGEKRVRYPLKQGKGKGRGTNCVLDKREGKGA